MRCDANISIMPKGSKEYGTRAEIKNINSFSALERALEYEIDRQIELVEEGGEVVQETRLWNDDTRETKSMRSKEDANDYRYFPEPDLMPLEISREWVEEIRAKMPELPNQKRKRYQDLGLSEYDANVVVSQMELAKFFDKVLELGANPKTAVNFLTGEITAYLKENHQEINDTKLTPENLAELIALIEKGINDYLSENKSIISENFSLYELEEVRCPCCGTRKNRFKSFFTFDLDIENINIQEKNKIKLYDCLDRLFNTNKKKVYCDSNKCHDFTEADCTKSIIKTPTIFAFLIDRKNFDKNLMDINFVIDEKINLRPYMYYSCNNVDYQLKAIVSIFIIENKYINFVKIENIWYAFDDKNIQKVEYDDIFNTHRESSIQHIPCILIYELINNNNDNNNKN